MTYIIISIISLFVASGQVLLKHALNDVSLKPGASVWEIFQTVFPALFQPKPLLAIALCGMGSVIYFMSMRFIDLSQIVPMTAGSIVALTAIIGWLFFQEPMQVYKLVATSMIIGGVLIVGRA